MAVQRPSLSQLMERMAAILATIAVLLIFSPKVAFSFARQDAGNGSCPTWLYRSEEEKCVCGSRLLNVILCNNISQEVSIQNSFCLTSYGNGSNDAVAGRCLYAYCQPTSVYDLYDKVNKDIFRQDQTLCGYLNREGRLCGKCKQDHYVSAYSYDLKCYKCSRGLLENIILYLTVAYVPLTVFLAIVVIFHVSFSAPHLHGVIYLCQCFTMPTLMRVLIHESRCSAGPSIYLKIEASLYGIWNLDFFRTLIPPICLPLNTMQVIALDYLVAVYPLLVLMCVYVLVSAHDRGCRLVVQLWRPFLSCFARMRQQFSARYSIIDAFATFVILSYIKFVSISGDLLIPTQIFNINGTRVGYFVYYDATVEFMGTQHLPYFILAIAVTLTVATFPLFLLLYPMKWFQAVLNNLKLNTSGLRMFMECFQGYYHDRSDGGRDCRYFSAVYPTLRIVFVILYAMTHSNFCFCVTVLILIAVVICLLLVHPYKKKFKLYNKMDIVLILSLGVLVTSLIASSTPLDKDEFPIKVNFSMIAIFSLVPLLYFTVLVVRGTKKYFTHGCVQKGYNMLEHSV